MLNVLVLADTHLREGQGDRLIERLGSHVDDVDAIIHAGDVTDSSVLSQLAELAPVHAVLGNNDHGLDLPQRLVVVLDGCDVAVVHDSGPAAGRTARLRRRFPDADVVVFGHSHLPWHEVDVRPGDGHVQHQFNPGSATQRRAAPSHTAGLLRLESGAVAEVRHLVLP